MINAYLVSTWKCVVAKRCASRAIVQQQGLHQQVVLQAENAIVSLTLAENNAINVPLVIINILIACLANVTWRVQLVPRAMTTANVYADLTLMVFNAITAKNISIISRRVKNAIVIPEVSLQLLLVVALSPLESYVNVRTGFRVGFVMTASHSSGIYRSTIRKGVKNADVVWQEQLEVWALVILRLVNVIASHMFGKLNAINVLMVFIGSRKTICLVVPNATVILVVRWTIIVISKRDNAAVTLESKAGDVISQYKLITSRHSINSNTKSRRVGHNPVKFVTEVLKRFSRVILGKDT